MRGVHTNPITYALKDLMAEPIKGRLYEQQVQKAYQGVYRIGKVLPNKKNTERVLVKWKGYPDKFKRWISKENLI